jgi:hypothetical protein
MPAVSEKQKRFMQAVAHNKGFAKKVGVPQSVGSEFSQSGGGKVKAEKKSGKKPFFLFKKKDEEKTPKFAKGGGIESRGKTKGTMVKMAKGGRAC